MDPFTRLARREKPIGLNGLNESNVEWTNEQAEGALYALGYEVKPENMA